MIEKILAALDVHSDSVLLYQRILQAGNMSAGQLARTTGLARATVYDHLDKLARKGLIKQSQYRGVKSYSSESLQKITKLFDQKIDQLTSSRNAFEKVRPILEQRINSNFIAPRFQIFEGPEAIKNILNDIFTLYWH